MRDSWAKPRRDRKPKPWPTHLSGPVPQDDDEATRARIERGKLPEPPEPPPADLCPSCGERITDPARLRLHLAGADRLALDTCPAQDLFAIAKVRARRQLDLEHMAT